MNRFRTSSERRRTFRRVEDGEPAACARAYVEKCTAVAQRFRDRIYRVRDLRQLPANGQRDGRIFPIQRAQNLES